MYSFEASNYAFPMLVAKLILGDDGDKNETNKEGENHRPHQAITVIAARYGRINEISSTEPCQRND